MARKSSKPRKAKAPAAAGQTSESLAHPKPLGSISSTAEVPVSSHMIDQIIGQEKAVAVIRKAAAQKRNVLLVGSPGTGKSMLAQAMAELIPIEELQDVLIVYNPEDENVPKVKVVKAGDGRKIVQGEKMKNRIAGGNINVVIALFLMVSTGILLFVMPGMGIHVNLIAAMLVGLFVMGAAMMFASQVGRGRLLDVGESSKLLVDNSGKKKAPFIDATGAKAGALLGDVKHDPFQSSIDEVSLYVRRGKKFEKMTFGSLWNEMVRKHPGLIERREDGYEAIVLPKRARVYTLGEREGKVVASRLLVINRRPYRGKIVEVRAAGTKLETTPEHSYVLSGKDKNARDLKCGDSVLVLQGIQRKDAPA